MNRDEIDQAEAALAGAEVTLDLGAAGTVDAPPVPDETPMVVVTLRLPPDLYRRIKASADERGLRSTPYMRELLETAVAEADEDRVVMVRRSDLLRAVDAAAHRAA